jgi:uncharacterized phage protein gp47/JayE
MALTTFSQIVSDLITYMLQQNQKIDVSPGQVVRDIAINGPASVMETLFANLNQVQTAQSILNATSMATQDLNNLVANFGITRQGATPALGTVTFSTPTQPVADVDIPVGTTVATSASNNNAQITFTTISDVQFIAALQATYFNPNTGNWEVTANVQAVNGGSNGNVGPFTINQIINFNTSFNVSNPSATSGGTDQESNQALAIRTINSFQGNNRGTEDGYLGTILSQPNVLDALVQGPGDPLMVRDNGLGGKVDIWTLTSNLSSTELNATNTPSLSIAWNNQQQALAGYQFNFPFLPVDVNSSLTVVGTTGPTTPLVNVTLFESRNPAPSGVPYIGAGQFHYTFNPANDLNTAHSVEAGDNIIWNPNTLEQLRTFPSGLNSGNSLQLNVDYSYDQTINTLQTLINSPSNKIITADVLVKAAIEVTIDVNATINLLPAYSTTPNIITQTQNTVIQAVTNSINNTQMGTDVQESDIIQTIMNVTGVSNVVVSSVILTRAINPIYGIPPEQVIDTNAAPNEYLSPGTISITVM